MKTPKILGRVRERFLEAPLPDAVFQVAARSLAGIRVFPRERSVGGRFIGSESPVPRLSKTISRANDARRWRNRAR